jgi:hypothetical protein
MGSAILREASEGSAPEIYPRHRRVRRDGDLEPHVAVVAEGDQIEGARLPEVGHEEPVRLRRDGLGLAPELGAAGLGVAEVIGVPFASVRTPWRGTYAGAAARAEMESSERTASCASAFAMVFMSFASS